MRNYRSHASLLHIPNRLFYHDSLQARITAQLHPAWVPLRYNARRLGRRDPVRDICRCLQAAADQSALLPPRWDALQPVAEQQEAAEGDAQAEPHAEAGEERHQMQAATCMAHEAPSSFVECLPCLNTCGSPLYPKQSSG